MQVCACIFTYVDSLANIPPGDMRDGNIFALASLEIARFRLFFAENFECGVLFHAMHQ